MLTFESFGDALRLNGEDYRIDKKTSSALVDWFRQYENKPPDPKQRGWNGVVGGLGGWESTPLESSRLAWIFKPT